VTVQLLAILGTGLVDPDTPVLRADDLGLTRGDGCFEGARVVTSADGVSAVDKLEAHLARMSRSAAALGIAFDEAAWRGLVGQAVAAWAGPGEAAMRLLLTRGRPGSAAWSDKKIVEFFPRLNGRLDTPADFLSGGEQQMVAVARALSDRLVDHQPAAG